MNEISDALQRVFGFNEFRQGQRQVIDNIMAGRSTLAVFPTGGGKSLCFQLPALHLEHLTLVVSPLIALMKDQVDFLVARGIGAFRLDSTLPPAETREIYAGIRSGRVKILYVAPERFNSERFIEQIGVRPISLLAIDEAHCISEWGHNFRPEYLKLAKIAKELGCARVLALTATATTAVAEDIRRGFNIAPDAYVNTGYYRPNLTLELTAATAKERSRLLAQRLRDRAPGATIVYVSLQRTAEIVAEFLQKEGLDARAYHAGMEDVERSSIQEWFMQNPRSIIVATIAFGMGIDKSDIRYIYHYNLPKNLESYSQEIGRAGRDGKSSHCELFACRDDVVILQNFVCGDTPTEEAIDAMVHEILAQPAEFSVSLYELSIKHDVRQQVAGTLLVYLELAGVIATTKPFYSQYRVRFLKPEAEVVERFDPARRAFLQRLFAAGQKARLWTTLPIDEVAVQLDEPRERIIRALNYLEEQGEIEVAVQGVRQGYRKFASPADVTALIRQLVKRFVAAERLGLERIDSVLKLIEEPGCVHQRLIAYFGERLPNPCGHCHFCLNGVVTRLDAPDTRLDEDDLIAGLGALTSEHHPELAAPRQMTRFLCGISSPATSRGRPALTRHPLFGVFGMVPFAELHQKIGRIYHLSSL